MSKGDSTHYTNTSLWVEWEMTKRGETLPLDNPTTIETSSVPPKVTGWYLCSRHHDDTPTKKEGGFAMMFRAASLD